MQGPSRILVVDGDKLVRWSLRQMLEAAGHEVEEAGDAAQALAAGSGVDLLLLGHRLLAGAVELRRSFAPVPVVLLGQGGSAEAATAARAGVYDCVDPRAGVDAVHGAVARALEAARLRAEVARSHAACRQHWHLDNIVAESAGMQAVVRQVRQLAAGAAPAVLVRGELGAGKKALARALHCQRTGCETPFVAIVCDGNEPRLQAALFGSDAEAGADPAPGALAVAAGGTVYLDEIAELPLALQRQLEQALAGGSFRRPRSGRELRLDAHLIAGSSRELEQEAAAGRFDAALLARLQDAAVLVPPLRERSADVLPLATACLHRFATLLHKPAAAFDAAARQCLLAHAWPGNVRELHNVVERAVLLGRGPMVTAADLPPPIAGARPGAEAGDTGFALPPGGVVLEQLERDLLRQALQRTQGNRTRAARLLGINRDRLRYRIHKFHLQEFLAAED